ncbi:hypothetical protein K437DRAFT_253588 [Tilletiaria anomala UBC 951]|uniref:Uncharacterized protein n=1 Tax=Tilletiaria anomala (strain ATCC 24038 / CBS 436.72 / UBC 951) TaxID=1037660 RepID=A0A066WG56_TILAU|nr:uncharacterized protein K437DRAFT_253588 [Tilletiaria anomala UBC 951]KDN52947.1 hypothetical protein K437DRAFT_253588 [Tilletiaria anomala UBC 951]
MALQPSLRALQLGATDAPNTLEFYIDYVCPFSRKAVLGLRDYVIPLLSSGQFKLIIRPYVQPWHWTSTLTSEGALAIAKLASHNPPEQLADPSRNAFWLYTVELMEKQEQFFEAAARSKSSDGIRQELTTLAVGLFGGGGQGSSASSGQVHLDILRGPQGGVPLGQAIKDLLRVAKVGNAGNSVGADVKYCNKLGRQNGIHVTPTALWNGVVDGAISSSFSQKEWRQWFEQQLGPSKL